MIFLLVCESSSKKQTVQRFKFSFKKHIHKIKQTSMQNQYPIYSVGGATKKQMSRIRLSARPPNERHLSKPPDERHFNLQYSITSGTAFTRPSAQPSLGKQSSNERRHLSLMPPLYVLNFDI